MGYDKLQKIIGDNIHKSIINSNRDMLLNRIKMIEKEKNRIEYLVENFYQGVFDKFMCNYLIKISAEKSLIELRLQ